MSGGKKESILDLARYIDKTVSVKLQGGRTVQGVLKGYDQLLNLVLDETIEYMRAYVNRVFVTDIEDPLRTTTKTRSLGLSICRGTAVMLVSPKDGTEEIANPFVNQMEEA